MTDTATTKPTKRRTQGEGTVRRRADKRWEGRLVLPDGRTKTIYRKSKKELTAALFAARQDIAAGLDVGTPSQSMAVYLAGWLDRAGPSLRPSTVASYHQLVRLYIGPAVGHVALDKLTADHVARMLADMTARGLSPRTVGYTRAVLRRALGSAVKRSLVTRNVATLVDPPRMVRTPVEPMSAADAVRFLDHARREDDRLWPLFTVAVLSGLRVGELLALRWRDVDLAARTLRVTATLQRVGGVLVFAEPKTKRSRRTLSLPAPAVDALRAQRDRQTFERRAFGEGYADTDLVFTTPRGTPVEPSNLNGRLHRLLDGAGLPRQGMHALRHCCASLLAAQGVPLRTIMEQLGHSQISLTSDLYVHLAPAMLRDAAAALEDAFAGTGS